MDFQHRPGAKPGSGPMMSYEDANIDRRERLRKIAMERIDISKDPYFMRNHLGTYECRLCLTLHTNEGSYLSHTQGKKHQSNLSRRQAREARETMTIPTPRIEAPKKRTVKIGRPGYRVIKQKDPDTSQKSLIFEIDFSEIDPNFIPRHRIMSAYEQKVELPDKNYQYLVVAAEPYENIAFKIPNLEIDKTEGAYNFSWDKEKKVYHMAIAFKNRSEIKHQPGLPSKPASFNPITRF